MPPVRLDDHKSKSVQDLEKLALGTHNIHTVDTFFAPIVKKHRTKKKLK